MIQNIFKNNIQPKFSVLKLRKCPDQTYQTKHFEKTLIYTNITVDFHSKYRQIVVELKIISIFLINI